MAESKYIPAYTITNKMVNLISQITELVIRISLDDKMGNNPKFQRDNRMREIQASLSLTGSMLSVEQVAEIINGKNIYGPLNEICEVRNVFEVYGKLGNFKLNSLYELNMIHSVMMKNLTDKPGVCREKVAGFVEAVLEWISAPGVHPLIKSCIFRYEMEVLQPFKQGNGRVLRAGSSIIMNSWKNVLGWIPIDSLIIKRQEEYEAILAECLHNGDRSLFIEFILKVIRDTLVQILQDEHGDGHLTEQAKKLLGVMGNKEHTTKELMNMLGLHHRPTFRDNYLLPAIRLGYVEMTIPDKPNSRNQKYRKINNF